MADQPQRQAQTPSGSRWEPDDNDPTVADLPAAQLDDPAAEERRAKVRGRAILAGAATALTLGGGLTGFVIGHTTAADDDGFRPANFSRQGPDEGRQFGNQPPPGVDGDGNGPGTSGNPT
jgi:hypothetical protein